MRRAAVLAAVLLAACSYMVHPEDWTESERRCSTNGGVRYVDSRQGVTQTSYVKVECKNGALFSFTVTR